MSEKTRFWLVFAASVAFSIGGLLLGVILPHHTADAGRGGAVGTAVALSFLFITRDYGSKLYVALTRELPELKARIERIKQTQKHISSTSPTSQPAITLPDLEKRVNVLVNSIALEGEAHVTESRFMAAATWIGTIVWGFGDWGAEGLLRLGLVIRFQQWAIHLLTAMGFNIRP